MIALGLLLLFISPSHAAVPDGKGILRLQLDNGIRANLYTAEHLAKNTVIEGSRGVTQLNNNLFLNVITDINDPLIQNKGDGRFHPFDHYQVIDLLGEIVFPWLDLEVDVYLLPYPRANLLTSSTSGRRLFLSPQVLEISREGAAYILAHEIGHAFHNKYLPDRDSRQWSDYRQIRGILDPTRFSNESAHAYQPKEIFAEDFRVLFGGTSAFFGGNIENPELVSPLYVPDLKEFFWQVAYRGLAQRFITAVENFPNPFNPETELIVSLTDESLLSGEWLSVRIYDVRGALVRNLYSSAPSGVEVRVRWDGRDDRGNQVATAAYFAVAEVGRSKVTQKLLMIK